MKCKKCGKEISKDASFCIHCGEKNEVSSALVEKPASGSLKKIIIAAIIIIMAGLVGIFAYLGNNSFKKKNSDKNGKASNVLENESEVFDDQAAPETPVPTETAVPTATNTPTPTSTSTPVPTATNTPSPTPVPVVDRTSSREYFAWAKDPELSSLAYDIDDTNNLFYAYGNDYWQFWRFTDNGIVGIGKDRLNSKSFSADIINSENVAYAEMYAGFIASIKDNRYLEIKHYYNDTSFSCTKISITFMNKNTPSYTVASNKDLSADLYDESYTNGFYAITADYVKDDITYRASMYLYLNCASNAESDFNAYICYGRLANPREKSKGPMTRQTEIEEMISAKGITPENSLNYNLAYPYEAEDYANYRYDTDYWINKSDEIIKGNENASDAYKACLLHDWMTENLVYDYYKANYLGDPRYHGHYDTGEYYVSKCYVGVCRDFVNIYAIMCRRAGVPCIILGNSSEGHVWSAVYLYDQWLEVDLTGDIQRYARNADVTDVTPATNDNTHCYTHFCNYAYSDLMPTASEVNKWLHLR